MEAERYKKAYSLDAEIIKYQAELEKLQLYTTGEDLYVCLDDTKTSKTWVRGKLANEILTMVIESYREQLVRAREEFDLL